MSVTRSFWLLVRGGDLHPEQFVCPSTFDQPDPALVVDWYYDFAAYRNISYAYQVPFGPRDTRPREGADPRTVFAADKGPYYLDRFDPLFTTRRGRPLAFDDPDFRWRPYNSPNHQGWGQNILSLNGVVSWERTPIVGIDYDNIYTLMTDDWGVEGFGRLHGQAPHFATVPNPYPGQSAFGTAPGNDSATDSLLYP